MADNRIKSAYELAMEKIDKMGEASEDERRRWKLVPEGEKLAVKYFEDEADLAAEFTKFKEEEKSYVAEGVQKVLLSRINLPKTDSATRDAEQALDGFAVIKEDKEGLHRLVDSIGGFFNHYYQHGEQQRQEALANLKAQFGQQLQQSAREMGGSIGDVDPETLPQFGEQKRRMLAHLDLQYINHLDAYKKQLAELR